MSAKRDYYEVLGISKTSPTDEIKKQYRKLALKFHPDRNSSEDAAEHFKEISEAYAVLSDTEKRGLYDQHGHAGVDGRYSTDDIFQGAQGNFSDIFGGNAGGFESIFENLFGSGGAGRGRGFAQDRGADILYETSVDLEDVLHGKRIEMNLQKKIACEDCSGSGCKSGTDRKQCSSCGGYGEIRQTRRMGFASFVTSAPCNTCSGQGSVIETPCETCKGRGRHKGKKWISIKVPPGLVSGDYPLRGEGDEMPNGVNGDLIVRISVKPHEYFERDGKDIYYSHHISMIDATLGCSDVVPTLDGKEKIKIDSGTQPHKIIKIKGRGVPHVNMRGKGDQYVRVIVDIPKKINKSQKRLLEEFQSEGNM